MGWKGVAHFAIFVGGTPLLAILNPVFWLMTALWFIAHPAFIQQIFPGPDLLPRPGVLGIRQLPLAYLTLLSCRITRRGELLGAALIVPVYWVMMSMAAVKALWQLVGRPAFWEKTVHGLDQQPVSERSAA